jgi:DNA-directed RNA polymerase sigma subunit (sigma70/sigma32)
MPVGRERGRQMQRDPGGAVLMSDGMTLPSDIAAQLEDVRAQLDDLQQERARLLARRDRLVVSARHAGGSLREIAALVGLSHEAVRDIERHRREEGT